MPNDEQIIEAMRGGGNPEIDSIPDEEEWQAARDRGDIPGQRLKDIRTQGRVRRTEAGLEVGDLNNVEPDRDLLRSQSDDEKIESEWWKSHKGTVPIDLEKVGYNTPEYEKLALLAKFWAKENSAVRYEFANKENPDDDKLIFSGVATRIFSKGDHLKNIEKNSTIIFSVGQFNEALARSGIRMRVGRRWIDDKEPQFEKVLRKLRLNTHTFAGKEISIESFPVEVKKESKTYEMVDGAFNLTFNKVRFDRMTKDVEGPGKEEAAKNREAINRFYESWAGFPRDIEAIGLSEKGGKLKKIIMQLKGEKDAIEVPIEVARLVFGLDPHKNKSGEIDGVWIGKSFINGHTPQEILESALGKVAIDGVALDPGEIDYQIIHEEHYSPNPDLAKKYHKQTF